MKPKLIVEQKITAFVNRYAIYSANSNNEKGEMLAFAQQKRLAVKEKVTFYTDERKTTEAFSFRAEKIMDVHGKYFVEDKSGKLIGVFSKDFTKSLINSTWKILDAKDRPVLIVKESNQTLAVLRRFLGFIPIIGDIADIIMVFFRYHFIFVDPTSGKIVGKYRKTTLFRDHYMLKVEDDVYKKHTWQIFAAISVALDALQSR